MLQSHRCHWRPLWTTMSRKRLLCGITGWYALWHSTTAHLSSATRTAPGWRHINIYQWHACFWLPTRVTKQHSPLLAPCVDHRWIPSTKDQWCETCVHVIAPQISKSHEIYTRSGYFFDKTGCSVPFTRFAWNIHIVNVLFIDSGKSYDFPISVSGNPDKYG